MPRFLRQFVRLKPADSTFSKVVAVQKSTYGGAAPNGFLEASLNSPEISVGARFRHGQPVSMPVASIPSGAAVTGFEGLGDTVYMRGPLKNLLAREGEIYLTNPWPQLFWDMPAVKMVRPMACELRTQAENIDSLPASTWCVEPPGLYWYEYKYSYSNLSQAKTPITVFMEQFQVTDPIDFSLRANPSWLTQRLLSLPRPIGVVHPPVIRREWFNKSRNPRMEYLQAVINERSDIFWVSVGWMQDGQEWPDGAPLTGIRAHFDHGELSVTEVAALISIAKIVLCGPSFPLPLSAALGTPVLCLFGGSVPPRCLVDPRMGSRVGYAAPEPFCACFASDHDCHKALDQAHALREFRRLMALA